MEEIQEGGERGFRIDNATVPVVHIIAPIATGGTDAQRGIATKLVLPGRAHKTVGHVLDEEGDGVAGVTHAEVLPHIKLLLEDIASDGDNHHLAHVMVNGCHFPGLVLGTLNDKRLVTHATNGNGVVGIGNLGEASVFSGQPYHISGSIKD